MRNIVAKRLRKKAFENATIKKSILERTNKSGTLSYPEGSAARLYKKYKKEYKNKCHIPHYA